jgi:hypothetical protein
VYAAEFPGYTKNGQTTMARQSLLKEFFLFIKEEKKWWLVPLIAVLLIVGVLIVFAGSSPLAPFLYPLF